MLDSWKEYLDHVTGRKIKMKSNYWLLKSEPEVFSIDHLATCKGQTTAWDHVRNYQARNFIRDQMKPGDLAFFYHSNAKPPGIAGIVRITKQAYPDASQFDPTSEYFDHKSTKDNPRWYCVDVMFEKKFPSILSLENLKNKKELSKMVLLNSSRLSVQPVTKEEWNHIIKLSY